MRRVRASFLSLPFEGVARLFTAIAADVEVASGPYGAFNTTAAALAGAAAAGDAGAQEALAAARARAGPEAGAGAGLAAGAGGSWGGGSGALRDRAAVEAYIAQLVQRIEQQVGVEVRRASRAGICTMYLFPPTDFASRPRVPPSRSAAPLPDPRFHSCTICPRCH